MDPADLNHRFEYHPPRTPEKVRAHEDMRAACRALALVIDAECPDGREKSLAITKIEEAMFWGNAAIARDSDA
jgi:hypothetical protein